MLKPLFVLAAFAVLPGGAAFAQPQPHPLPQTHWALTGIAGNPLADGVASTLNFGGDGSIGGEGGCNVFGGNVTFEGASGIEITDVFSTMMACEDAKMAQERAFFDALESAVSFALDDGVLSLADENGTTLAVLEGGSQE